MADRNTPDHEWTQKSRELSFEHLWIYYILNNDKDNIPNAFSGVIETGLLVRFGSHQEIIVLILYKKL